MIEIVTKNPVIEIVKPTYDNLKDAYQDGYTTGNEEGYNDGYATGSSEGYNAGKTEGYEIGKADGYNEGYGNGWNVGNNEGITEGYNNGYTTGKEDGIQSEYDRFWDSFQSYGKLTNYQSVFGGAGWKDDNFKPKYVPNIRAASLMFRETGIKNIVGLDFSKANDFSYTFYASQVVYIDEISTISASRLYQTFDTCTKLKTIGKLILKADGTQTFTNPFGNCTSLENIEIEGVIGNNGFNVSKSKLLTHDSLMSIINHLKDFSGTTETKTLTLGETNLNKLTAAEKAIATQKGWTLA